MPRVPPTVVVLGVLLAPAACAIDFGRYLQAPGDAATDSGVPSPDRPDVGVTDTGAPPGDVVDTGRPPVDGPPAPCRVPYLAATIEHTAGGSTHRVWRRSLDGTACSDVGTGTLSEPPQALAQLPTGELAVASSGHLDLFDAHTGEPLRSVGYPNTAYPLAVFAVTVGGRSLAAVALDSQRSADPEVGTVVLTDGSTVVATWTLANFLGSIRSMATHPTDPTRYLALRGDGRTLAMVPGAGMHTYADIAVTTAGLDTLQTWTSSTGRQVVWTRHVTGQSPRVLISNPSAGADMLAVAYNLSMSCAPPACTRFLRAVGDPGTDDDAFALCEVEGEGLRRYLVKLRPSSGCVVLDGVTLGARERISNLTVVTR